jgi:hypothetical protein
METLVHDVRYALRTFGRMRGAAAVAVITLALGIRATTTMFSVAYAALLRWSIPVLDRLAPPGPGKLDAFESIRACSPSSPPS